MTVDTSEGYRQTNIGFLPEQWDISNLDTVAFISMGQSPDSKSYNEIGEGLYLIQGNADIKNRKSMPRVWTSSPTKTCEPGDILITVRAPVGAVALSNHKACIGRGVCSIRAENANSEFLYQYLIGFEDKWKHLEQGSTFTAIGSKEVKQLPIPLPPLPEQKKIAEVLTSVDEAIETTGKVIEQTKKVKQGLLQELLTRGIGHDRFKKVRLGNEEVEIPEQWEVVTFGSIVESNMPPIIMDDEKNYSPTIVRRRHAGIEIREIKKGKEILVKNQFKAIAGTFLISRRQIIHGSCGIVPENLKNAIVSKEYLALQPVSEKLNILYLDYFSLTPLFQHSIIRTTYGVDDEKFVFKDKWWMKESMPLPPLEEQNKIVEILSSVNNELRNANQELSQLEQLKKGLMQYLLTGKVRVKV